MKNLQQSQSKATSNTIKNQQHSFSQLAEIKVSYRPHFKAIDRPQLTSSNVVFDVLLSHWDMDTIDLLNANFKDIEEMLMNVELKDKFINDENPIKPIIIDKSKDKSEFLKNKHEYIQLAVTYCYGDDKVYSIKENYNGREEGAVIIEYKRSHHTYLLVENENLNRSAHLFTFDKNSTENVEKVCGFYLSDKENKRGIIKERGIDFKKEFNTVFNVKTLYHSDFKKYRDHLLEYLYRIG